MVYQIKDNTGSLFNNERKEKETHPDKQGTAVIDGVEYYISGWIKQSQKGSFMSLAFKPKNAAQKQERASEAYQQPQGGYRKKVPYTPQNNSNDEVW